MSNRPPTTRISIFPTQHDHFEVRGTWAHFPDRDSIVQTKVDLEADCTIQDAFDIVLDDLRRAVGSKMIDEGFGE